MDDVDDFLKQYQARAMLSRDKMYAKPQRYRYSSDYDFTTYDCASSISFEREPYVEMYIPQDEFRKLVEKERYYKKMSQQHDYATQVVNQQVQDEVVRKQNPSVEIAWRKYQMLLELARK